MSPTVSDIERWDAGAVETVGAAAGRRAQAAVQAAAGLAALPALTGWDGVAADAARAAISRTIAGLDAVAEESAAIARAAARAAERITAIKSDLNRLREDADAAGRDVRDPPLSVRLAAILAEADAVDAELARVIRPAAPALPARPGNPADRAAPEDVATWWGSLSDADRAQLVAGDPERIGNLDGVPAADRDIANRAAMQADRDRITDAAARHRVPADAVLADPPRYGLTETHAARYTSAIRIEEALFRNAMRTGAETLLLLYRPEHFGGQGRAAIAIGNPDRAVRTTVLVPGTGNSVTSGWLAGMDASNLFSEIAVAAGDEPTCVVAWMGYDAPDSMLDPRVAVPDLARRGGALLAADVNALRVTADLRSHLTVVGHSYGSTTVADAAAGYRMHTDDVVLVGSPGTDIASRATDFHLPTGGHVYVGSASSDPVTTLSGLPRSGSVPGIGLGADPAADGFGSTRFKAEVPGFTWQTWTDHSRYFDRGSESLYSIADIAAGDGSLLAEHGMTAPHRPGLFGRLGTALGLPNWSTPLADPELPRPATSGHLHAGSGHA